MNVSNKNIFAESTVLYCLVERFDTYLPGSVKQEISDILNKLDWGKSILEIWDDHHDDESFKHIFMGLEEKIDKEPSSLLSIFTQIRLGNEGGLKPKQRYYELLPWEQAVYNPTLLSAPSKAELNHYWNKVFDSFKNFVDNASDNSEVRCSQLIDWSDTWLSCISIHGDMETVPLATHLRLMLAISATTGEKTSFQLVLGDISGIQSYLFDIAHIGAGQVAKRLRSRSFMLGLLSDISAHKLLKQENMPITNLVLSAGGLFYAILPTNASIAEWEKNTNEFLYHRFHGAISLHSAVKTVHLSEINKNFPDILSSLYSQIQESKGRSFNDYLISNDQWNEEMFIHELGSDSQGFCKSCGKFPKKHRHEEFCEFCALDSEIGKMLPKTRFILFKEGKGDISFGNGIGVDLLEDYDGSTCGYLLQLWNENRVRDTTLTTQRKWIANYVPTGSEDLIRSQNNSLARKGLDSIIKNAPLTFGHMAHIGAGKDYIGHLKADVDHLGKLFTIGFVQEEEDRVYTFGHIATLSQMFERFFAGGVDHLLREKYPSTYTVYSGGDDLYLIGPWQEMLMFTKEIRYKFNEYVGINPDVTLSAGLLFTRPKFPMTHAAHKVEMFLDRAKEDSNSIRRLREAQKLKGRNQLNVMGVNINWDDFKVIKDNATKVISWWHAKEISSSFLYQLNQFSDMYKDYKETLNPEHLKFVSMLEYSIQRNLIDSVETKIHKKQGVNHPTVKWAESLTKIDDSRIEIIWTYMKLIIKLWQLEKEGE